MTVHALLALLALSRVRPDLSAASSSASLLPSGGTGGAGGAASGHSCCSRLRFYVINLERREDRLREITAAFPACARERACRVSGIEGDMLARQLNSSLIAPDVWDLVQARTAARIKSVGSNNLTVGAVGLTVAQYTVAGFEPTVCGLRYSRGSHV